MPMVGETKKGAKLLKLGLSRLFEGKAVEVWQGTIRFTLCLLDE